MPYSDPEKKRQHNKKYYETHREEDLERQKKYRSLHREHRLDYNRQYGLTNREQINAQRKQFRIDNQERLRENNRQYYAANKERFLNANRRRRAEYPEQHHNFRLRKRARKFNAPRNDLSAAQWREIKAAYDYRCVYCGQRFQRLTMDHLVPFSRGGSHTASNVVPACRSCNSRKRDGPPLKPVQPLLLTISRPFQKRKTS